MQKGFLNTHHAPKPPAGPSHLSVPAGEYFPMTQPTLEQWLQRGRTQKPRKPLKHVSKKRGAANREYAKRRKAFLAAHPMCQAWPTILHWAMQRPGMLETLPYMKWFYSEEIHHTKKPKCKYLNDESTWLAVSRWSHDWIENHKDIARKIGLLK